MEGSGSAVVGGWVVVLVLVLGGAKTWMWRGLFWGESAVGWQGWAGGRSIYLLSDDGDAGYSGDHRGRLHGGIVAFRYIGLQGCLHGKAKLERLC